jgi:hypothetical protein
MATRAFVFLHSPTRWRVNSIVPPGFARGNFSRLRSDFNLRFPRPFGQI